MMYPKKIIATAVSIALSPMISNLLYADDEMRPIIISAARTEQSVNKTPASIHIIDRQMIEQSGATTVSQLLTNQSSIQLNSLFGTGARTSISLRGFGGNAVSNTLILIDGRRLNNPDISAPDIQGILIDDIEQIEIIEGSAGALYGDNAVGGVINIITRNPVKLSAAAALTLDNHQGKDLHASFSNRLDNGFGFRTAFQRKITDNYRDRNELGLSQFSLRLDQQAGANHFFADFNYSNERLQFPGPLTVAEIAENREQAINLNDQFHTRTTSARFGTALKINDQWHFETDLTARKVKGSGFLKGDLIQKRNVYSINPRFIGEMAKTDITIGLDYEQSRYFLESGFGVQNSRQKVAAIYAQTTFKPIQPLSLTAGARYTQVKNKLDDSFTFPQGESETDQVNAFSLGASWQFSPALRLYSRWDQNFRLAKVDENLDSNTAQLLKSQTGDSYELALEYRQNRQHLRASIFRIDLEDEIALDPEASSFGPFPANRNLEDTRRTGATLEANWFINRALRLGASYTWLKADFTNGQYDSKRIPLVAKHHATINATWQINQAFYLNTDLNYLSARDVAGDFNNTEAQISARTLLNLSAAYKIDSYHITARIDNVANKKYNGSGVRQTFPTTESVFYPAPERLFMLTFGVNL